MAAAAASSAPAGGSARLESKEWCVIYPVYISSTKRVSEGRKVALAHACLNPSALEIALICEAYKLRFEVDRDKSHPRDASIKGRVRVVLKGPDGKPVHPEIPSKMAFLRLCGAKIPQLKHRDPASAESDAGKKGKKKGKK